MTVIKTSIPTELYRPLLADWFAKNATESGLEIQSYGGTDNSFEFDTKDGKVIATYQDAHPFLRFESESPLIAKTLPDLIQTSVLKTDAMEMDGHVWFSTTFVEPDRHITGLSTFTSTLSLISEQRPLTEVVCIDDMIILEPRLEPMTPERTPTAERLIIDVHIAAPGPPAGFFADTIVQNIMEVIHSICVLVFQRKLIMPARAFHTRATKIPEIEERFKTARNTKILRHNIVIAPFYGLIEIGGTESYDKMRAALISFSAAFSQERDSVACLLYVVAAEALTTPNQNWKKEKLTGRFVSFFESLIPDTLDSIIRHGNFEQAFGISRGTKEITSLRRKLLNKIYAVRSEFVHEGIGPSYGVFSVQSTMEGMRRLLIAWFAEAAILKFMESPRDSCVGHTLMEQAAVILREQAVKKL